VYCVECSELFRDKLHKANGEWDKKMTIHKRIQEESLICDRA
jgi:hypothetical protein